MPKRLAQRFDGGRFPKDGKMEKGKGGKGGGEGFTENSESCYFARPNLERVI